MSLVVNNHARLVIRMKTVLFCRPDWGDLAMQYGSYWTGLGVAEATKRGFEVVDLYGEKATKDELFSAIRTYKPEVVILAGHGSADTYTSQELEVTLKACENDEIMNGTISHFLSCIVGQTLLPSMISKGAIWTIGYQESFTFMVDTSFAVEEDPLAEPFRDVTVTIIKAILDGYKLKQVWDIGIAKCNEWIAKLWERPEIQWGEVISSLKHDRDCMIGLGSEEAYIMPPTKLAMIPMSFPLMFGFAFLALGTLIYKDVVAP